MGEIESLTMMLYNVGHHPDLHLVGWNNVTIEIWTHSVGMNISLFKNQSWFPKNIISEDYV